MSIVLGPIPALIYYDDFHGALRLSNHRTLPTASRNWIYNIIESTAITISAAENLIPFARLKFKVMNRGGKGSGLPIRC